VKLVSDTRFSFPTLRDFSDFYGFCLLSSSYLKHSKNLLEKKGNKNVVIQQYLENKVPFKGQQHFVNMLFGSNFVFFSH
jgi:hypothetical protein